MAKKTVKKRNDSWGKASKSDGWSNLYSGLGTALDKTTGHLPSAEYWYDEETLEAIYHSDAFAQRITTELVDTAFRNGWQPEYDGEDIDAEQLEEERKAIVELLDGDEHGEGLRATETQKNAIYWGRLYGRGALLLGADDRVSMETPLDFDRIQDLYFLEDIDSRDFFPLTYYEDPLDKNYGYPEIWTVQRQSGGGASEQTQVHGSRLLIYGSGIPTSKRKMSENSWRWQPLLQLLYDKIRNLSSIEMSLANMMTDASQAVLKIVGLAELLASEDVDVFAERMRILTMGRGIRVLPIDEEETYEYIERTFTGIGDVYDRIASVLSGTSKVPQVLLFGRSNPGLSNEDVTADRYWSGQGVEAQQVYGLGTTRLVRIAAKVIGARDPQGWYAKFNDIWTKTPEEQAAYVKAVAESDKIYHDMTALLPEEIAVKRFGSGEFDDGTPQIDKEARQAMIEGDMERMKKGPEEPEEIPIPPQMQVPLEQAEPQVIGQTQESGNDEEK